MHVLSAAIWGAIVWVALVLLAVASDGPTLLFVMCAPFVISGAIVLLLALSLAAGLARWMWRCRGTLRLWRSPDRTSSGAGPL